MYELPTELLIDGQSIPITNKGDFRMVLDCFICLNDLELTEYERIIACLIIFYDVKNLNEIPNLEEAIKQMFWFFDCGIDMSSVKSMNYRLIDWERDTMLVCSAVNKVAGKEIRAEQYIHWWTFIGYYIAIGECSLSLIVQIRYKTAKNEKLEKYERKFKQENPQYFNFDVRSLEDQQADNYIRDLWNKNSSK